MRRTLPLVLIAVSLVAGYLAHGVVARAQSAQDRSGALKYAYVVGMGQNAVICFAESGGCRMQAVTVEPVTMTTAGRTMMNVSATRGAAVARAVSQLGESGWEMIGAGPAYATEWQEQALHFKLAVR